MDRQETQGRSVCLISRQRISGKTNGSSVYVLGIVEHLKAQGFHVHYLSPSPATFGRWPVIALRPEMAVFDSIRIHGSLRLGRYMVVLDPRVWWNAGRAMLARMGIGTSQPAPYAIAVPLTAGDAQFVSRHAKTLADVILLDYAFLTPVIPHVGRPESPSMVIMHDLFSARASMFGRVGAADTVAALGEFEEKALLDKADMVLAIQDDEAAWVRNHLPGKKVAVVPCAIAPARQANPGDGNRLLFVGSKTAPNRDGLRWFLQSVWPLIRAQRPGAYLSVAGSVCQEFSPPMPGVEYLGVVPDLGILYRRSGVVISPLQAGSGLKIKLIEALGWGKAIVATSITTQGVRALVEDAISIADDAEAFARETLALMADDDLRAWQADRALSIARQHFSAAACYKPVVDFINHRGELRDVEYLMGLRPSPSA